MSLQGFRSYAWYRRGVTTFGVLAGRPGTAKRRVMKWRQRALCARGCITHVKLAHVISRGLKVG